VLVETFNGVDQVSVECIAAHFAIGDDFHAGIDLQINALIDGTILDSLELSGREIPSRKLIAGLL
jgi:hypothetical protein